MTRSAGAVQARYEYDPYGKRTKLTGFRPTLDMDFGYTGHYHHAPSGMNLALYRAYNSAIGRWFSRDPILKMTNRRRSASHCLRSSTYLTIEGKLVCRH